MQKLLIPVCAACLLAAPAQAGEPAMNLGPGTFVGAQFKLPLGGRTLAKPRAGLAIAPTRVGISTDGMVGTQIGEGISLDFTSAAKPTLRLGGIQADRIFGLQPSGEVDVENKLGVTTGGWVAIGVGTVAVIVGGLFLYGEHIEHCERQNECD